MTGTAMQIDRFSQEVIKDAFAAVGEEMFHTMIRTAMSPIIYEATDFAVGATDADGNLLAQGNGVTAFLASLDGAVKSILRRYAIEDIRDGDVFLTNTPYEGGTHLSDVSTVVPIFVSGTLIAWTVIKAHWTEIGGMQTGSLTTQSTEIFQEGLQFTGIRIFEAGRLNEALLDVIRANVRLPDSTIGDMHAGVAACRVGARRITDLANRYGVPTICAVMESLLDYGHIMTQEQLRHLPQGSFSASTEIEEDGHGNGPFVIRVKVTLTGDKMVADFTGTSPQAVGPINIGYPGLIAAARCVFRAITDTPTPVNGGCFRALEVICEPGTILSAVSPAPVSFYFEPLQAAMDVIWKALAPALPDRLPAGHQRSVSGTFISGHLPETGALYVMGEPLLGGWGAGIDHDGAKGQFSSGNGETFNIPIELAEARYGLEVVQYAFHDEDGGAGRHRGGNGVVLDYRVTGEEAFLTYVATQTRIPPWGLDGGMAGTCNRAELIRTDGSIEVFSMVTGAQGRKGDVFRLITGTGGGYGDPNLRDPDLVRKDLRDGYINENHAITYYNSDLKST